MNPPFVQTWLTLEEAAQWLRVTKRKLAAMSKGRGARIPAVWLNQKTGLFHPATIIAKLADERMLKPNVIKAILSKEDTNDEDMQNVRRGEGPVAVQSTKP